MAAPFICRIAVIALSALYASCSGQKTVQEPTKPLSSLEFQLKNVSTISDKSGFEIPCLQERPDVTNEGMEIKLVGVREPVFRSWHKPENCELNDFDVYERLANLPRNGWEVQGISVLRTASRPFAYKLLMNHEGIGADSELTYLDSDGDGTLDLVFQSPDTDQPVIPDWLFVSGDRP